jgi:hypothetical protein
VGICSTGVGLAGSAATGGRATRQGPPDPRPRVPREGRQSGSSSLAVGEYVVRIVSRPDTALLLFPWVVPGGSAQPAGPLLLGQGRLRRRKRWRCAPPWTCEPRRPRRAALQAGHGLPSTSRGAPGQLPLSWTDQPLRSFAQVTTAAARAIKPPTETAVDPPTRSLPELRGGRVGHVCQQRLHRTRDQAGRRVHIAALAHRVGPAQRSTRHPSAALPARIISFATRLCDRAAQVLLFAGTAICRSSHRRGVIGDEHAGTDGPESPGTGDGDGCDRRDSWGRIETSAVPGPSRSGSGEEPAHGPATPAGGTS